MKKSFYFFLPALIIFVLAWSFSVTVHADAFYYTCADFQTKTVSCSDDTLHFVNNGEYALDDLPARITTGPSTVYFNARMTGSGTLSTSMTGDIYDGGTDAIAPGDIIDHALTVASGNSYNGLYLRDGSHYTGDVSLICVSDNAGECEWPSDPEATSTSATSSSSTINEDLFNGYVVFLASFFGMILIFKRRS